VKTHLTSAVNQEIVLLKSQIKQLTEKCARLEQENSILKKHALPETLSLIENRGSVGFYFFIHKIFDFLSVIKFFFKDINTEPISN
jgi:hypothetical protein